MLRKLFPFDKNYILKEVQQQSEDQLLIEMVDYVKGKYQEMFNPLGLEDDTIRKIKRTKRYSLDQLREFYFELAGIYRYHNSDNQLELLFDGSDHYEKYSKDWQAGFAQYIRTFCQHPNFLKAVLEATIFYPKERKAQLACNRMKAFMSQTFEMKLYKNKGLMHIKSA